MRKELNFAIKQLQLFIWLSIDGLHLPGYRKVSNHWFTVYQLDTRRPLLAYLCKVVEPIHVLDLLSTSICKLIITFLKPFAEQISTWYILPHKKMMTSIDFYLTRSNMGKY